MLLLLFSLSEKKGKQKDNIVFKTRKISVNFNESNIIEDKLFCLYKPRQVAYI